MVDNSEAIAIEIGRKNETLERVVMGYVDDGARAERVLRYAEESNSRQMKE